MRFIRWGTLIFQTINGRYHIHIISRQNIMVGKDRFATVKSQMYDILSLVNINAFTLTEF